VPRTRPGFSFVTPFANGDLAHFLFPKILWAEKVILGVISN
jgi:hypothetical protein